MIQLRRTVYAVRGCVVSPHVPRHARITFGSVRPPFGGGAVVRRVLRNVSGHPSTNFSGEMRALELTPILIN
jgi:hypothetical protein